MFITAALLSTLLTTPSTGEPTIAPRLAQLAESCQANRGISPEAFHAFLREPKRQRAGWTVVVSGTEKLRLGHATGIAVASGAKPLRVSLDEVVGKYVGETEKNLSALFDKAQQSDLVLFFDEADALFGKRTSVKDSHDRYANQEIAYITRRLKEHADLVIVGVSGAPTRPSTIDWVDTIVTTRPQAEKDAPLPWHRVCWPPRPKTP
jgi:hypothetical protein